MRHSLLKLNTRLMALAMAVMLLLCSIPAVSAAEYEGTCGDGLTWSITGDTLTITGTGDMWDFPENRMAPWNEFREQIATVILPDGLTRVGDLSFYGFTALETMFLPDTVTDIGWHAFDGCTALTIVDLGDGLQTIGDGAFQDCVSVHTLRLPGTLTSIGFQSFYRCESLAQITVPASVTKMGMTAFGFCYSLVRADIQAQIDVLPDWTFYGCDALGTVVLPKTMTGANEFAFYGCTALENVVYTGSDDNRKQIEADIRRDLEKSPTLQKEEPETSTSVAVRPDGDTVSVIETTIGSTGNANISTSVITTVDVNSVTSTNETRVTITLETAEGWNDVADSVAESVGKTDSASIEIYIKDQTILSDDSLSALAGKKADLTVHTAAGSSWRIDCAQLKADHAGHDLSYDRVEATEEQLAAMTCYDGFQIRFLSDSEVNAEVMIRVGPQFAYRTATLFFERGGLNKVQTVLVDAQGYAHFYLANVDSTITYLVGIDVPNATVDNAIVPDTMYNQYGVSNMESSIKYEITGRKSSWNMDINQVTWIMVGALGFVVITVGIIMFMLNKRKLQMGYVPDLEDEDEEQENE